MADFRNWCTGLFATFLRVLVVAWLVFGSLLPMSAPASVDDQGCHSCVDASSCGHSGDISVGTTSEGCADCDHCGHCTIAWAALYGARSKYQIGVCTALLAPLDPLLDGPAIPVALRPPIA